MSSERFARLMTTVTGTLLCALTVFPSSSASQDPFPANPLRAAQKVGFTTGVSPSGPAAGITSGPSPASQIAVTPDNTAALAAALFYPTPTWSDEDQSVRATDSPAAAPPAQRVEQSPASSQQEALLRHLLAEPAVGNPAATSLTQHLQQVPSQSSPPPEPLPADPPQLGSATDPQPVHMADGRDWLGCDELGCDKSGCDGSGCDDGCAVCSAGCLSGPIWDVGTEFTFLAPNMNDAEVRYDINDYVAPVTHSFVVDHLDSLFAAPRFWVGVQGECWGIVGRFWRMTAGHAGHNPFFVPGTGIRTGYDADNLVDAYAIDLEVRRTFCFHANKLYLGLGPRYAHFEQDQSVTAFALVEDDILTGTARSNRHAYGTGLSLAFGGRRPLFCNSCAHLFFNMRASILWGCTHAEVQTSASLVDPSATAASYNGAAVGVNDDLFIGEIQLGMEWDYQLKWLPANAFFRVAAEYQYWDASQGYAVSTSFADEAGVVASTAFAEADGLRMNLIGFTIGTGLTW